MNIKIILKLSVLIFAFVLVIMSYKYFASPNFHDGLDALFNVPQNTGPTRDFEWCSAKQVKFDWAEAQFKDKFKSHHSSDQAKAFCTVAIEQVSGDLIKQAKWKPLAKALDSAGKAISLDWDPELRIYRAGGLPFKSTKLTKDLGLQ